VDSFTPATGGADHTFEFDLGGATTAFFQVRVEPAAP
jgi:hypothetical protein